MRKQKDFITELINSFKKTTCLLTVKAEEPQGEPTPQPQGEPTPQPSSPTVNFEDLIANARKQEKAKLYPQIEKLQGEKNTLVEKNNAHLLTIGEKDSEIQDLKKQLAEANKNTGASEKESKLLSEIETLNAKIKSLEENTVSRETVEAEIKAEYEVKLYREQKLRELGDTVIPELIIGNTVEEIEASVKVSQERYQQITSKIIGGVQVPVANVNTSTFQAKDLKVEDIANLDPRSPEYAQLRAKLGLTR